MASSTATTGWDDRELLRRSVVGYGEMLAALSRRRRGEEEGVVRVPGRLVGAAFEEQFVSPWTSAATELTLDESAIVDLSEVIDEARLPGCIWAVCTIKNRVERPSILMPCLAIDLAEFARLEQQREDASIVVEEDEFEYAVPPFDVIRAMNEQAYGIVPTPTSIPLITSPNDDPIIRAHGLRLKDPDAAASRLPASVSPFVCIMFTMLLDGDLSIQYVATERSFRRRGLASRLLRRVLHDAYHTAGARTASLQATPDGLSVYERLGFRRVGALRAFLQQQPRSSSAI